MNVSLLTHFVSSRGGGVGHSVLCFSRELARLSDTVVQVHSLSDESAGSTAPWVPPPNVRLYSSVGPLSFGYAPGLAPALQCGAADLVHTHGLWTYFSVAALQWSRRAHRPSLVTPHGMLDSWALQNSHWKKRIATALFESKHLQRAACLHALCAPEADAIRAFGLRNPICVIPNGVDLPPSDFPGSAPEVFMRAAEGHKVMLYLGRIHPKKGLVALIRSWARMRTAAMGWRLVVAGWDQCGHENELRQLVCELGLLDVVRFIGPLFGEDKAGAYRHAEAFVLPSLSEGLPLVVLEAWAYGLPVLMTPACNLPEGFAANAAFQANPDVDSLAEALGELFRASLPELRGMGQQGRALVAQKFTWSEAAQSMEEIYKWLLGSGPSPACVVSK